MAKKITPTPAHKPSTPAIPAGMVLVNEAQYAQAVQLLTEQNDKLKTLRADMLTVCSCFGDIAGLLGPGGFSMAAVMNLVQQKDKLAEKFKPLGAVLEKYAPKTS